MLKLNQRKVCVRGGFAMWPIQKRRIEVMFSDGKTGVISPYLLNTYIETGKIVQFKRRSGWVRIGEASIRGNDGYYEGRNRRRH